MELGTTLRSPERVERLVLVDTYGIQRTAPIHRISYLVVKTLGMLEATWALTRRSMSLIKASLPNLFHDPGSIPAALSEFLED